ncbi:MULTISPECIES: threonine/serine exporter family protein [unclassified Rhodanobacter]|uniref:threonine/serine ThrE exporter family protein n=1 Tax=unclassified Rhodanobacter TaxID=2621553 RepID=UPI001BDDF7C2|nr:MULTISPECIES: threonine/serine exporter family protein [unclassified Rhodanobacter]MBT2143381.1 threonine/serine exporter family protein [Rhodanobacter sp. LX-99]MBT2147545.1 threonine/serine exporter family protein [Rhodanobacter sp. LX-100]
MSAGDTISQQQFATTASATRIAFVLELARRLHQYGTSAPRLEMAIAGAAQRLGLSADVWSSPTAIIISFADLAQGEEGVAQTTQVMRLAPGEVNLERLCEADDIADRAIAGELGLREGFRLLRELGRPDTRREKIGSVASYGLSAAGIAALFLHSSWVDLVVAGAIGVMIGWITLLAASRPRLAVASDAICALVATTVAIVVSAFVVPLAIKSVVLASLIILVPGMSLTNAVREISSGHLVSGMARMGGAMSTLLKLTFGTIAATQLCAAVGITARDFALPALPTWTDYPALLVAAVAFAILFRAARRDWPVVIVAVVVGYLATRWGGAISGSLPGAPVGVFLGGLLLGALANVYARFAHRPGAVIREPGILLLVPGSVGFRSVSFLLERDTTLSVDTGLLLVTLLVSLVAGLMFGDLLVSPRRSL